MKVIAAEYMDNGQWGILTEDNRIIVAYNDGLTQERAKIVAGRINQLLAEEYAKGQREA